MVTSQQCTTKLAADGSGDGCPIRFLALGDFVSCLEHSLDGFGAHFPHCANADREGDRLMVYLDNLSIIGIPAAQFSKVHDWSHLCCVGYIQLMYN